MGGESWTLVSKTEFLMHVATLTCTCGHGQVLLGRQIYTRTENQSIPILKMRCHIMNSVVVS